MRYPPPPTNSRLIHRIPFLEVIRRRTRHAWLLHFVLILSLLLLPAGRQARADGDDGSTWTQTSTESSVTVSASAPEGTSGMTVGDTRQVIVNAQLSTWEVWTNGETGATEIRNAVTNSLAYSPVSFTASAGSVSPGTTSTDGNGNVVGAFTMGSSAATVTATLTDYGATGSVTFDTPTIPEIWTWDHDESLLMASLSTNDSTDNVPAGATRQITAHVDHSTWAVDYSNFGNTRTRDFGTSPAIGATVNWSAESGDGSISGSSSTDDSGNASTMFTMGALASVVRADVSYAGTTSTYAVPSTYATLGFTPAAVEETWTFDHAERTVSGLTLSANGSTDSLDPGMTRDVTAAVSQYYQEVWVSNLGNSEYRNGATVTAESGVPVSFSTSADGSISATSATTDGNGNASVTFTMGNQNSGASAYAGPNLEYSDSIGFYRGPETWSYDHTVTSQWFSSFTSDANTLRPMGACTLTAEVMRSTYEVWVSNYGNTENRNQTSPVAAPWVNVGFAVTVGDGQLWSGGGTTDYSGHAPVGFTMQQATTTVQAQVDDGQGGTSTADLSISLGEPVWQYDHTEGEIISVRLTADGSTDMLHSGDQRTVTAEVNTHRWEIWRDDAGNTERRNESYGSPSGASVSFTTTEGNGTLDNQSTDPSGYATIRLTMGTQATTVQARVDFYNTTSYADLRFTCDPWVYDHSEGGRALTLELREGTSSTSYVPQAVATVSQWAWDVYTDGAGHYENRNCSDDPEYGVQVDFTPGGDVTLDAAYATTGANGEASVGYECPPLGEGDITAQADLCGPVTVPVQNVQDPPTYRFLVKAIEKVLNPNSESKVFQIVSVKWNDKKPTAEPDPTYDGPNPFEFDAVVTSEGVGDSDQITNLVLMGGDGIPETITTDCKIEFHMKIVVSISATNLAGVVTHADDKDIWNFTITPWLKLAATASNIKISRKNSTGWHDATGVATAYDYKRKWGNYEFIFAKDNPGCERTHVMKAGSLENQEVSKTQPQQSQ